MEINGVWRVWGAFVSHVKVEALGEQGLDSDARQEVNDLGVLVMRPSFGCVRFQRGRASGFRGLVAVCLLCSGVR